MSDGDHVDLGFVEETEDWRLVSHLFPSKVGGKPAWLSLSPLPTTDDLKCGICSEPCIFLLQLYAPLNEKNSFHRTLFIFICRNPQCCKLCDNKNFIVFRSDLPRRNNFYSFEPPEYERHDTSAKYPSAVDYQTLCAVCGSTGTEMCSLCKTAYCTRSHQVIDWKGGDKCPCSDQDYKPGSGSSGQLFAQYGLDVSSGSDDEGSDSEDEECSEDEAARRMKDYEAIAKETPYVAEVLEKMAFGEQDKLFEKFKKVVQKNPDQVIRHDRGGEPLWITDECKLQLSDVPECQYCGSRRTFEFQVLPQLICKLQLDSSDQSIDWGTLVVYTCSKNCTGKDTSYHKEFLYKQDFQLRK